MDNHLNLKQVFVGRRQHEHINKILEIVILVDVRYSLSIGSWEYYFSIIR